MRIVVVSIFVALVALPAAAGAKSRKHAQAHRAPPPAAHVVPNDRAAQEHARAEAELADLRAGRVSDDKQDAMPPQVWAIQENDKEVPANLRKK
jgi:hypothetical protein